MIFCVVQKKDEVATIAAFNRLCEDCNSHKKCTYLCGTKKPKEEFRIECFVIIKGSLRIIEYKVYDEKGVVILTGTVSKEGVKKKAENSFYSVVGTMTEGRSEFSDLLSLRTYSYEKIVNKETGVQATNIGKDYMELSYVSKEGKVKVCIFFRGGKIGKLVVFLPGGKVIEIFKIKFEN